MDSSVKWWVIEFFRMLSMFIAGAMWIMKGWRESVALMIIISIILSFVQDYLI
jgi:hypothetical protein